MSKEICMTNEQREIHRKKRVPELLRHLSFAVGNSKPRLELVGAANGSRKIAGFP
jgi:hypothetical protein